MAENVTIDLEENSKYRVALELAHHIASSEVGRGQEHNRKYWLDLYAKCRKVVVDGWSAEDAIEGTDD